MRSNFDAVRSAMIRLRDNPPKAVDAGERCIDWRKHIGNAAMTAIGAGAFIVAVFCIWSGR